MMAKIRKTFALAVSIILAVGPVLSYAAEFEVVDRLVVDGYSLLKTSVTISGNTIAGANPVLDVGAAKLRVNANGNVGVSTGNPQGRIDIVSAGSAQTDMAQIWRRGDGLIVGSMSATGVMSAVKFEGDGAGLSNVTSLFNIATDLGGGAKGDVPYQNGINDTVFLQAGGANYLLQANGAGMAPTWTNAPTMGGGNITNIPWANVLKAGSSLGDLITKSAADLTSGILPLARLSGITNTEIAAGAGIVDTKLATIATALKVSNSATTAASANTASAIVARDASGNFSAGTITANTFIGNLTGNVSGTAGGAPPTGAASGGLTGNYPGPTLATTQAPAITWNGAQTFSNTITLPGIGTNQILAGTGDGASYGTYNFALRGWYGMAFTDHTSTVHGVYNFRTGDLIKDGSITTAGNITLAGGSSSNWASLNVGGSNSINTAGNIYSYAMICAGNSSGSCNSTGGLVIAGSGTNVYGNTYLTGSGNSYFNGGNVGIGTTGPTYKTEIVHTADVAVDAKGLKITATAGTAGAAKSYGLWVNASGSDDANYAAIFENGNVGIGKTNPGTALDVNGTVTWTGGNSSHLGTGANVTTYVGNSSVNNALIRSNDNSNDAWLMNWGDSAAYGIYNRNIDTTLSVSGAIDIPANSTAFIGAGLAKAYISHATGDAGFAGTVTAPTFVGNLTGSVTGDAHTTDGLHASAGVNNAANQLVRTDVNGYIQAGWINTISGDNGNVAITRVYASQDAYLRYYSMPNFIAQVQSGASGNWPINAATATNSDKLDNLHDTDFIRKVATIDGNMSPGNIAAGLGGQFWSPIYTNNYPTAYGHLLTLRSGTGASATQIAQAWPGSDGGDSHLWVRGKRDGGVDVWGSWSKVWDDRNDGTSSGLDADLLRGLASDSAATVSTVMTRDTNGDSNVRYLNSSYLNMSHAASGATADTIFYSSTDNYIRKNDATGFRASLNVPTRTGGSASGDWGINVTGHADENVLKAGDTMSGNLVMSADTYTTYGPNSSWGSYLRVGGNGRTVAGDNYASMVTTNGNLHLDAGNARSIYLNFYAGTGGTIFGNGASGSNASVSAAGVFTGNGSGLINLTPGNISAGTAGISITGTAGGAPPTGAASGALAGTYPGPSLANNVSYPVAAGDGNGLKFWGGADTYKISMGNAAEYHYGPVTDYSIKTAIDSVYSTRGFTWGVTGVAPVAALNVGNGNFQVAGTITAPTFSGNATSANYATNAGGAFGLGYDGNAISGAGVGSTWDTRPGGNPSFAINYHTGVSISGYPGYGGVRLYSAGYPTHASSVLRLEASDKVYVYGTLQANSDVTAGGSVSAAGASGFYSSTYVGGARNPIWRFANADGYGLSYFQGAAGIGGSDTIGFHFGTPTAAASLLQLNQNGTVVVNGNVGIRGAPSGYNLDIQGASGLHIGNSTYDSQIVFGNDTTWRNGIRSYDNGQVEMRIWTLQPAGEIVLTNGYNGDQSTVLPTDGLWVKNNLVGLGNFSVAVPSQKLNVNGSILVSGNIMRTAHSNGFLLGSYNNVGDNSAKSNPIYTIGSSYQPTDAALSNMYGIGYSNSSFWGGGKSTGWGLYTSEAGVIHNTISDSGMWTSGAINANGNVIAFGFQGNGNVGGTGSASWHPSGIYSAGPSWLYGSVTFNGAVTGASSISAGTFNGAGTGLTGTAAGLTAGNVSNLSGTWWSTNYFGSNKGSGSYLKDRDTYGLEAYSTDSGAAAMSFHRAGYYAINMGLDPDNAMRIGGWSNGAANRWTLDTGGNQTVAGFLRAGTNIYTDANFGYGLVGLYTSTKYQGVYAMGDSFKLAADGSNTGNLYGLAWSHPNAGGVASNLNTHGLLVMEAGGWLASVSGSIRARDDVRAPALYDSGSRVAISRTDGRNFVDYSRNVYNNNAYSGSGWVEPSDLGVRYAYYGRLAYNNGAYSGSGWTEPSDLGVRYAASAGNSGTTDRVNSWSAGIETHIGTGMRPFYNFGGSNCTGIQPGPGCYTTGIQVGSPPYDQAYGFELAMNMWSNQMYSRGYDGGWKTWRPILHKVISTVECQGGLSNCTPPPCPTGTTTDLGVVCPGNFSCQRTCCWGGD